MGTNSLDQPSVMGGYDLTVSPSTDRDCKGFVRLWHLNDLQPNLALIVARECASIFEQIRMVEVFMRQTEKTFRRWSALSGRALKAGEHAQGMVPAVVPGAKFHKGTA